MSALPQPSDLDGGAASEGAGSSVAEEQAPPGLTRPARRRSGTRFISDVIVELGFLPAARVETAVEEGRATGRTPEQVLLDGGALSHDQLSRATAERFGLPHADLELFKPDPSAVSLVTPQAAKRFSAVPIGFDDSGALLVAMADPSNIWPSTT